MERPYWLTEEREAPAYAHGSHLPVNVVFRVSGSIEAMERINDCLPQGSQTSALGNGNIAVLIPNINQDELGLILDALNGRGLKTGQIMRVIE
jgi:hypothetical protein